MRRWEGAGGIGRLVGSLVYDFLYTVCDCCCSHYRYAENRRTRKKLEIVE